LGHGEAVSVSLDAASGLLAQAQLAEIVKVYFEHGFTSTSGGRLRLDPQDAGAEYRNVIGLPGGKRNAELWPIVEKANVHRMPLLDGEGGPWSDTDDNYVVYVYDSVKFPFFRGEAGHQFHKNSVLGRPVPLSYTGRLKRIQEQAGRLDDDLGCVGVPAEIVFIFVFVSAYGFSFSCMISGLVIANTRHRCDGKLPWTSNDRRQIADTGSGDRSSLDGTRAETGSE
jgi:hypothetical protein